MSINLKLLKSLIRTGSVFPKENDLSCIIDDWVKKNVICNRVSQKVVDGRKNLVYSKGSGKKTTIMLIGHQDTVPVAAGWDTDPLDPVVHENKLFGLGAWDMKAGLYVILQCLKNFEARNINLKVAFTVDEENYSIGAHKLVDSGLCDDADFIMVPEPGFIYGERGLTLGRTGRMMIAIKIFGKSSHGNYIDKGVNAIYQAYEFIKEARKINFNSDTKIGMSVLFPRVIESYAKGFTVPDECLIELDSVLIAPDTPETIFKKIKELGKKLHKEGRLLMVPEIAYKERPTPFCTPYTLSNNNRYIKICKRVMEEKINGLSEIYNDAVADECIFVKRLKIPAICIGPSGANAHKPNEYVNLDSVEKVESIYMEILKRIDNELV